MDYEGGAPDRFDDLLASSIAFEADSLSCEDDLMWSRCLAWWEASNNLIAIAPRAPLEGFRCWTYDYDASFCPHAGSPKMSTRATYRQPLGPPLHYSQLSPCTVPMRPLLRTPMHLE